MEPRIEILQAMIIIRIRPYDTILFRDAEE